MKEGVNVKKSNLIGSIVVIIGIIIATGIIGAYEIKVNKEVNNEVNNEEVKQVETSMRMVHTKTLKSEPYTDEVSYSGYVMAAETKNFAFELSGTVDDICVAKGEKVKKGDVLARLNTTAVQLGLDKARQDYNLVNNSMAQIETGIKAEKLTLEQMETSYDSNIAQLQSQYDLQKDVYEKSEILYEQGGMSKVEFDKTETEFKVLEEKLNNLKMTKDQNIELQKVKIEQLQKQYEGGKINLDQTQIGIEQSQKYINDSVLTSTMDGYILEICVKEGEVAAAGNPIVIVKTENQVINMGVPVEDYDRFSIGMEANIEVSGQSCKGIVSKVELYPDENTMTYNVEITPENKEFVMGSLATITIRQEEKSGCFIPISAIVNIEGVNYVYKLEKEDTGNSYIVKRQEVTLGKVNGETILVDGLEEDAIIIDEELRDIRENEHVFISE